MAILQPIKPQYCELIASGKKTIEVRKTRPKLQTPFKVYIYCTKDKTPFLLPTYSKGNLTDSDIWQNGNGKVIGEYVCDDIVELEYDELEECYMFKDCYGGYILDEVLSNSCLSYDEICKYGKGKTLYLWHISDLKIYDKPKELSEFRHLCIGDCDGCKYSFLEEGGYFYSEPKLRCDNKIKRPPQSFCYVEEV